MLFNFIHALANFLQKRQRQILFAVTAFCFWAFEDQTAFGGRNDLRKNADDFIGRQRAPEMAFRSFSSESANQPQEVPMTAMRQFGAFMPIAGAHTDIQVAD